ncbi:MAG: hypothetical protein CVT74_14500, partial [Alphaproteobacteria bacterium HGW-Alphaproteobacteria-13]
MTPAAGRPSRWALLLAAPLLAGATPPAAVPIPPPAASADEVVPFIQPFDLDATEHALELAGLGIPEHRHAFHLPRCERRDPLGIGELQTTRGPGHEVESDQIGS